MSECLSLDKGFADIPNMWLASYGDILSRPSEVRGIADICLRGASSVLVSQIGFAEFWRVDRHLNDVTSLIQDLDNGLTVESRDRLVFAENVLALCRALAPYSSDISRPRRGSYTVRHVLPMFASRGDTSEQQRVAQSFVQSRENQGYVGGLTYVYSANTDVGGVERESLGLAAAVYDEPYTPGRENDASPREFYTGGLVVVTGADGNIVVKSSGGNLTEDKITGSGFFMPDTNSGVGASGEFGAWALAFKTRYHFTNRVEQRKGL